MFSFYTFISFTLLALAAGMGVNSVKFLDLLFENFTFIIWRAPKKKCLHFLCNWYHDCLCYHYHHYHNYHCYCHTTIIIVIVISHCHCQSSLSLPSIGPAPGALLLKQWRSQRGGNCPLWQKLCPPLAPQMKLHFVQRSMESCHFESQSAPPCSPLSPPCRPLILKSLATPLC